jgi:hypothetical protein
MIDGRMTECMKSLFCQIVRMVISLASWFGMRYLTTRMITNFLNREAVLKIQELYEMAYCQNIYNTTF